jgi:preprotein translocase subunit SecY
MIKNLIKLFKNKELRKNMLTILFWLLVFRLIAAIPIPNVDLNQIKTFLEQSKVFGLFDIFTGGAFGNLSIGLLGVSPYISASIIMQLVVIIIPSLKEVFHENGEEGRRKFEKWTKYLTLPLTVLQAVGILNILRMQKIITINSPLELWRNVLLLTAAAFVIVFIGEIITQKKLGNGISLIIFSGIIISLPQSIFATIISAETLAAWIGVALFFLIMLIMVVAIVYLTEGERRLTVSYAKHVRGNKMYGGVTTFLPLKVNQAGVIPIIFALSILTFPALISQMLATTNLTFLVTASNFLTTLIENKVFYASIYFILVFLFTFFYTSITFEPKEISDNLQKNGGFIPGYRPGENTVSYLSKVSKKITLFGAIFLGLVAVLPMALEKVTNVTTFEIGGTSLLLIVAIAIEIKNAIEAQLAMREYDY